MAVEVASRPGEKPRWREEWAGLHRVRMVRVRFIALKTWDPNELDGIYVSLNKESKCR